MLTLLFALCAHAAILSSDVEKWEAEKQQQAPMQENYEPAPAPSGPTATRRTLCPDGKYISGDECHLCPDGTYNSTCELSPNGKYTGQTLCPDGTYVAGPMCRLGSDGKYY